MSAPALQRERGDDGVLVVTFDLPGERVNTLGRALLGEFEALLADLEGDPDVRAVVLQSGKPDSFIAGADIKDFVRVKSALEAGTLSRSGQQLLDRLAAVRVPVVAAIHGACLGGGLELALACGYRIATNDPKTTLGQPEVMLGLVPGAGGTQRLPRLVGLRTGLDLILTGRALRATRAFQAGLVDEVVPKAALAKAARQAALALADGRLKARPERLSLFERALKPLILSRARSQAQAKTGGHYPAPLRALEVVGQGLGRSLFEGQKLEAAAFGELAVSGVSRALVSLFFATQEIKKDIGVPEGTEAGQVRKLGVVGAGLMGAGIAAAAAEAGCSVRLRDTSAPALGRGLRAVREAFAERLKRGSLSPRELGQRLDRISPTCETTGFKRAELVVEAVFEDLELKRQVLRELEAATGEECVIASNTSSIPIGEIAKGCRRPARVLGMHFFSPVHKMPLLEIVVTPETDAWATATAASFGRRLGKHVIVVRDGPGFYTTRVLAPYLNEAARWLEQGARIEDVDQALLDFGFPVGPLRLLDEVGIDVGAKVAQVMHAHFGKRIQAPESMALVLEDGRQGRKNQKGFYRYAGGKKGKPDESLYALLPTGAARLPFEAREIQERLVFALLNEAAHCLQDGVLRSPRDGDVGAVFGLGFPPFLGGPFRYLDHLGARFAVEVLERLAATHGERFRPAALLVEQARSGAVFHA